jgi:hypothetical protein
MDTVEKIVVVLKKTALEELIERFNTRDQARFYIEHMGGSFDEYQAAHDRYQAARALLMKSIPDSVRSQTIEREFLPNFTFGDNDLVVTLGPDGLVVNAAKYLKNQKLLALNPDAKRIDGVLIPFQVEEAGLVLRRALKQGLRVRPITMAKAQLVESQSSSGIIVSTGAGSSGWYRSILTGAAGVIEGHLDDHAAAKAKDTYQFDPASDTLQFCVREPFISRISKAELIFGQIPKNSRLEIISEMPQNGLIFSDGIESDYLEFNSGAICKIGVAERKLNLLG